MIIPPRVSACMQIGAALSTLLLAPAITMASSPPNNQGLVTPHYNQNEDGDMFAKEGVTDPSKLDVYTSETVHPISHGYIVFAGQRSDGFYANIQSIFDLDVTFSGPERPLDSQAGFNVHTIVLNIPLAELGDDQQVVGVYATTSRKALTVLRDPRAPATFGEYVQVHRKGNPAFCELLVAGKDKDLFTETPPTVDQRIFAKYALAPELVKLLGAPPNLQTARTDLAGIFIPDLVKVDLSTGPAHLADNPNDPLFNRLGIFGGDTLKSTIQSKTGHAATTKSEGALLPKSVAPILVLVLRPSSLSVRSYS
jgi:Domain of unknown function (DUF4331)